MNLDILIFLREITIKNKILLWYLFSMEAAE